MNSLILLKIMSSIMSPIINVGNVKFFQELYLRQQKASKQRKIMNVFVTLLQHEHGIDLRVHSNREKALETARSYMKSTIDEIEEDEEIQDKILDLNRKLDAKNVNDLEEAINIYNEIFDICCSGDEIHHISVQEKSVM